MARRSPSENWERSRLRSRPKNREHAAPTGTGLLPKSNRRTFRRNWIPPIRVWSPAPGPRSRVSGLSPPRSFERRRRPPGLVTLALGRRPRSSSDRSGANASCRWARCRYTSSGPSPAPAPPPVALEPATGLRHAVARGSTGAAGRVGQGPRREISRQPFKVSALQSVHRERLLSAEGIVRLCLIGSRKSRPRPDVSSSPQRFTGGTSPRGRELLGPANVDLHAESE